MKKHFFALTLITLITVSFSHSINKDDYLEKDDIENDLAFLDNILQQESSYQGLNGFNYRNDFAAFLKRIEKKPVTAFEFGLFLSKTIGKIGDRHAYIKGFHPRDSLYFPIAFAPFQNKVLVINYDKTTKNYSFWDTEYPYLKSIHNIPIEKILPKILPGEIKAPKKSYLTYAVRDLRDIESIFRNLNIELPNQLSITLSNKKGVDKTVQINLVSGRKRARLWDERFYRKTFRIKDKKYNDQSYIQRFFSIENNIAYVQIADMLDKKDCPVFFEALNHFMQEAKQSKALIIDVRDNGGGTRHLLQELAGYLIHPDSIYVANAAKQRGELPLNVEQKDELYSRFLFPKKELDKREQMAIDQFMASFHPMYKLDAQKYSEYYYYILNGRKLSKGKYYYNKPVYILANERTFSAASVLVAALKGLPNIKIAGVNTDGSSGNSQRFELPNSGFRGKISTMVSYQKDGKVLDGIGTTPDIKIERNLDQIFFKEDYQLNVLKEMVSR